MLLTIVGTLSALSPVLAVFALIATGPRDPATVPTHSSMTDDRFDRIDGSGRVYRHLTRPLD